jgi:hypothetical protein
MQLKILDDSEIGRYEWMSKGVLKVASGIDQSAGGNTFCADVNRSGGGLISQLANGTLEVF